MEKESIELNMMQSIEHLEHQFSKLRTGKANINIFEEVKVDYYDEMTSILYVASVTTPEARQIMIKPYEKDMVKAINKAIVDSGLGFSPVDKGDMLIINIPPLTEDKRKQYVKEAEKTAEEARIAIRNIRRDAMDDVKKSKLEDERASNEKEVQTITDKFVGTVNDMLAHKIKELMTV